ncbi:MAG: carbohydrate ABC transporter permease [Christensenellales bacterium]
MKETLVRRGSRRLLVALFMVWTMFPIYWMFSLAIRGRGELFGVLSLLPRSFSLEHFRDLFSTKAFDIAILNSLQVTLISLTLSLLFGMSCAYILARARFRFKMKGAMLFWVLLLRILPPIAFALPLYILMSDAGLLSTRIPLILSHLLINIPFIVWFMITFFEALPLEVEESAAVDGASEHQLFTRIVIPQVLPGLTAVSILAFMTSWNEYLYAAIFVQSPSQFTIPLALSTLNSEQELTQWGNIAAGGVLSLVPIALFVLFAQNFLIVGLSGGAVKE